MRSRTLAPSLLPLLAALLLPAAAGAQGTAHDHGAAADSAAASHAAEHRMDGARLEMGDHLRLTPMRPPSAADSARAAALLDTLRRSIDRYRDVRVAEREGYRMFAPGVKSQRVYHFTNRRRALREHFRFDPAQPTSLLYRRDAAGALVLVGAMYVAPKDASPDELDARVPLSMTRWHAHTDLCLPPRGAPERWREMEGDRMRFGPAGSIATEAACEAAGGRFHEQLFGWMVHVNVYDGDPWGDHQH